MSLSAQRYVPVIGATPIEAANACSVEARSIGWVNRTDRAADRATPVQPSRGRNRTTAGACRVGAGSSSIGGRGLTRTGRPIGDGFADGGTGTATNLSASIGAGG